MNGRGVVGRGSLARPDTGDVVVPFCEGERQVAEVSPLTVVTVAKETRDA